MRITTLAAVAVLSAAIAAPALAQQPGGGGGRGPMADFATMDANKDGKVTKEEFTKTLPEQAQAMADQIFARRDANGDGTLSKEEADAPMGRGGRGPGGGAPGGQ